MLLTNQVTFSVLCQLFHVTQHGTEPYMISHPSWRC